MSGAQDDALTLALDLMRRLPPQHVQKNIENVIGALPNDADELASSIDQPLTLHIDDSPAGAGREFVCCDYNRDGESWRSWYSNTFHPPLPSDGASEPVIPMGALRELEVQANDAFDTYRKLYYDTGYTSTYLWELDGEDTSTLPTNFAGVVLFKKELEGPCAPGESGTIGSWDSIHVFEVASHSGGGSAPSAHYKVTSTIMLTLKRQDPADVGVVDLSGHLTRQGEETQPVVNAASHIANLGRLIEELENKMRNQLQEIYFGKMYDTIEQLRSVEDLEALRNAKKLQEELRGGWER